MDERASLLYRVLERAIELHNEEADGEAAAPEAAGGPGGGMRPRILAHMATFDTRNRLALHRTCTLCTLGSDTYNVKVRGREKTGGFSEQ